MDQERWTEVDRYITERVLPADPALEAALAASDAAGLPAIQVSPNMGKFLQLLAQSIGAREILEIGTLGGYSTIWLARAVTPAGRVVTLELNPAFAEVARSNLARAGIDARVEVRIGPALETLPLLAAEAIGPFDLIFIDADKESTAEYFSWALKLSRRGSLIVVDNVVREGTLVDEDRRDAHIQGIRDFYALAAVPGVGAGVLLRALEPLQGIEMMQRFRKTTRMCDIARGPGRLAQAMQVDKRFDLCAAGPLWLGTAARPKGTIGSSTRIGLKREIHQERWFFERGSPYVSGPRSLSIR